MNWDKLTIKTDAGEKVDAQAPIIISASRSTDIPAFYADWFVERWKRGYVRWKNPFNGKDLFVSFQNARVVVFWSKNPKPMLKHIEFLNTYVKNYYFQFTLNDYESEGFEGKVPPLHTRIETFKTLSNSIGKEKVIWRFDPMILTDKIDVEDLLNRVKNIGDQLVGYTNKLVFSYADIHIYRKVENNMQKERIAYREFEQEDMIRFAEGLQNLNKSWGFELATCSEKIPLEQYNIQHNKCIDGDLMIKLFRHDAKLMDFLGVKHVQTGLFDEESITSSTKSLKDKGQRDLCGCIFSKDIGQYNTCPHECVYCYANTSKQLANNNYKLSKENKISDSII